VFAQEGRKVFVIAEVTGLKPGPHGFHVHEKGDCSAADFSSAGGHFNPDSQPHGDPTAGAHHVGDMPMLVADASGKATARAELRTMSIGGGGRATSSARRWSCTPTPTITALSPRATPAHASRAA
jgi:Cu-Zn family superoxide dismutase